MTAPLTATAVWTAADVAAIRHDATTTIPTVPPVTGPVISGRDLWDLWPLQLADGSTARIDGWVLWFVLSAPMLSDPEMRHDIARIRLIGARDGVWRDHGNALPDGLNPGSREWAGSALLDPATGQVTLYWTPSGMPGEVRRSYAQRMFQTTGTLTGTPADWSITNWSPPREIAGGPLPHYLQVGASDGVPGYIKGFRDPAHFRDPADGTRYLLFTGSLRGSTSAWNGCNGLLRAEGERWAALPPLLSADGLNNEQERPHIVHHAGLYYLFWSTQRKVFAADGPNGPNGLYGMVADRMTGPWRPLNGGGLVAGNPDATPFQTYSWWVTADLTVHAFVDYPGGPFGNQHGDGGWRRAHFGGIPAPVFTLALDGERTRIIEGPKA